MDQGRSTGTLQPGDPGLRERIASHLDSTGGTDALIDHGEVEPVDEDKDQKTFGRTPDGTGTLSFWCHSDVHDCDFARAVSDQSNTSSAPKPLTASIALPGSLWIITPANHMHDVL